MPPDARTLPTYQLNGLMRYLGACLLVAGATALGWLLRPYTPVPNLIMVYLLAVVLAALRLGLRPAVLTAVGSAFAFNFVLAPAHLPATVFDKEYLPVFLGLLMVGLVISSLVATAQKRSEALQERELETTSLYRLSRELSAAPDRQALFAAVVRNAELAIAAQAAVFRAAEEITAPLAASRDMTFTEAELSAVTWASRSGYQSTTPAAGDAAAGSLACLPLVWNGVCQGVLALRQPLPGSSSQRLVEGFIAQIMSALQRIELAHEAEQAQVIQTRANFERSLLNSISHDLRTPLVSITGTLGTLRDKLDRLPPATSRQLLEAACSEADRLNRFVGNLLNMTRLEAGALQLRTEWYELQDLVGCALNALEQRIGPRPITTLLPDGLPPVMMDLVLMTQVLINVLDNALKYSPPGEEITISGRFERPWVVLEVADRGPGIPEQDLERIFDKFYRIPVPEGAGGTGLGLSICKGIVEAHGGAIAAANRVDGGARIMIQLAAGEAPS